MAVPNNSNLIRNISSQLIASSHQFAQPADKHNTLNECMLKFRLFFKELHRLSNNQFLILEFCIFSLFLDVILFTLYFRGLVSIQD